MAIAAAQAQANAPPGWDFCKDPSYYIRSCETGPYTLRWSGPPPGTCPQIAICGAHTKPCGGDDGFTYSMMDQGGGRYYSRPNDTAGPIIQAKWDDCYVNKINVFGPAYPCTTSPHPGGTQTYHAITWDELPEGGQKNAWGNLFGCGVQPVPNPFADWIEQLYNEGITAGCSQSPKLYCPDAPVTRQEMAVFLLKVKHGSAYVPPPCIGIFEDVECGTP